MLNFTQIQELLQIIEKNHLIFITQTLGSDFLTKQDKATFKQWNIQWQKLYNPSRDPIEKIFHLGMLSDALKEFDAKNLEYKALEEYIQKGKYIPLTEREKGIIRAIKQQTYTDIKSQQERIFRDVNKTLQDSSLKGQRDFLREEVLQGQLDNKQAKEIASDIAHKVGDWNRDFERIVNCNLSNAYNKGVEEMALRNGGPDTLVYKIVQETACESCEKAYLTNGIGSAPRTFKIGELIANGSNYGRKKADWKPVVEIHHPNCFCRLAEVPKGFTLNPKTKRFDKPAEPSAVEKQLRKPIRIWIAGKEVWI